MPNAARINDPTVHGSPLNPGPGSSNVLIGYMNAWRALPASVAAAVDGISNTMNSFMSKPQMTPVDAAADLAQICAKLTAGGAQAAAAGAPAAAGTAAGQIATLNTTNGTLTATWTTASAVPGGQPAANLAYTQGIQAAAATAASAVMSAMAKLADMHVCPLPCPVPPHGPGFVTKGSNTVLINNLPACRQDDKVMEACGGSDPIVMGCPTVVIGEEAGTGGGGGAGGTTGATGSEGEAGLPLVEEFDGAKANAEAEAAPAPPPPGPSTHNAGPGTHWIEIELVDGFDKPVPGEPFVLTLPDRKQIKSSLDAKGFTRINGLVQAGWCQVNFPKRDQDAWQRWTPKSNPPPAPDGNPAAGLTTTESGPVAEKRAPAGRWVRAKVGDTVNRIARKTGHTWQTLWNHPSNTELKRRRGTPNVLLPGDAVFIPDPRLKEEQAQTDTRSRFKLRSSRDSLTLQLRPATQPIHAHTPVPRNAVPYKFKIGEREVAGQTQPDGTLRIDDLPPEPLRAELTVFGRKTVIKIGYLTPATELSGLQVRLRQLGYRLGEPTELLDDSTRASVQFFQALNADVKRDGHPTPKIRQELVKLHKV